MDTNQDPWDPHSDAVQKLLIDQAEDPVFDYNDVAEEFVRSWNDSLEVAKQCIVEVNEDMAKRFETLRERLDDSVLKVGSKVWLDGQHIKFVDLQGNRTARKSLDQRRLGPYEILEVLGDGTAFRLKLPVIYSLVLT